MVDAPLRSDFPPDRASHEVPQHGKRPGLPILSILCWVLGIGLVLLAGLAVVLEARTSWLQAHVAARLTHEMTFTVGPGPSPAIRFPKDGPYDERLGYADLPAFVQHLTANHFAIENQARLSPRLEQFIDLGGNAIYREKPRAGLTLLDRAGTPIYQATYPKEAYANFKAVPPLVAATLMFIEDQDLLDPRYPMHNPAVEWKRFVFAGAGQIGSLVDPRLKQGGASTLATQIEKFRHSAEGRTGGIKEKFQQMVSATARAYVDGPDNIEARQRILTTYLDSTPLSSRPGYGEVTGVADGLYAWYGTGFAEANEALSAPAESTAALARKATIYKQVLSLLLAERRPSYYLATNRQALASLTDNYLHLLSAAGVIEPALAQAALAAALNFRGEPPAPPAVSFVGRKAVDAMRTELLSLLHVPNFYRLDRLDLTANTELDAAAQRRVTAVLARLGDPDYAKSFGLVGHDLLGTGDPSPVNYSVVLYERGADRNYLRVHGDSLNEPFDINSGAKLILGSTAKLRTLVTYLDIVSELHARLAGQSPQALQRVAAEAGDPLTRWAAEFLATPGEHGLQPMLDAAMARRYSGNPAETFFTGGGIHVFHNFERSEDYQSWTVEEAFKHSVNLAFVRIMRDVVHYYTAQTSARTKGLEDRDSPLRETYLRRFANEEGREYLNRFYDDYRGRSPEDALALLASRTRPVPRRLAVVFRSVRPQADIAEFDAFLRRRLPDLAQDRAAVAKLYETYAVTRFSLADRGYLAGAHPLELWLVAYLQDHPGASRTEVLAASEAARQQAYEWLFKTRNTRKQEVRIRILREEDAFDRMLQDWRRQGYPFGHLVPSLATALGSSGDRPDALARLMGIILNDGVAMPTGDIERLHFAAGTPYETALAAAPEAPHRVLAPEVAWTVRRALTGVVAQGTGMRVRGAYLGADGSPLAIGGKTGTGDNRFDTFGAGATLTGSRVVDRTATFVFFLGDRFFGTITAYVRGEAAARFHFTSALAVQLLKSLAPELQPLLDEPAGERKT